MDSNFAKSLERGVLIGALLGGFSMGLVRLFPDSTPLVSAAGSVDLLPVSARAPAQPESVQHQRLCGVSFASGE
jgi:hypothetical protein